MSPRQSEAELEAFFHRRITLLGGMCIKLAPTERGVPDRLVLLPNGGMYLVELKADDGACSPIQLVWHDKAKSLGTRVYVVYGMAGCKAWIRAAVDAIDLPNRTHELYVPRLD